MEEYFFPRKPIFNLCKKTLNTLYGRLVNILGATPTPQTIDETKIFFTELKKHALQEEDYFFPEGTY